MHRTTGPAVENWTVLPGGAHVLSFQAWYVNGKLHREGRPAILYWHVADDGTRVLGREAWRRRGQSHRGDGPSYCYWTMERDGTRRLAWETWRVNGERHRVDGPAYAGHGFSWHCKDVKGEDLPWLRRGRTFLTLLTAPPCGKGVPAWSRDRRVTMTGADTVSNTPRTYRSAVGGAVLLYV